MSAFVSKLDPRSDAFAKNRADMLALIERLRALNARAGQASEARKARFDARGQLTPRARLARLLDPGAPFLEIGNLAGYLVDTPDPERSIPGSTVIAGMGFVAGTRAVVTVDDSGIQAGAMTKSGGYRLMRAQEAALRQKLPFIHLVESAGGDLLNYAVEGFVEGGALFANLAKLSQAGVPAIAVLHGSSTAGGAYMPGLSDYVVAVKGRGCAFLAGPPLLRAATGEIATEAELGGAQMHAEVSGLADYLALDDADAVAMARAVVERLRWGEGLSARPRRAFAEPLYDPDEIAGLVPVDYRAPYDAHELIARLVDGSKFAAFKPRYGAATVCAQADVFGLGVGLIANNGPIDPEGAAKAAQFLQLCDQAGLPVVFLQNTTGYLVGVAAERAGIIKHGSKMIQAVTNIAVPKLTIQVGASFGAGNYGMCGRAYGPDFLLSWPNAKTGVMGGVQAAKTMGIVARGRAEAKGETVDEAALAAQEGMLAAHFDGQADAFVTSGRGLDDGVIDPRDTRKALGFLLETVDEARRRTLRPNSFGVARL